MPVSSRTSRLAASIGVSPGSTWPLGKASTREPSAWRRLGTITTTWSSRTTTPPAENSRACEPRGGRVGRDDLEDILLERVRVMDDQAPAALGDHPGPLEHGEEAAGRLARGARELGEVRLGGRDQHV